MANCIFEGAAAADVLLSLVLLLEMSSSSVDDEEAAGPLVEDEEDEEMEAEGIWNIAVADDRSAVSVPGSIPGIAGKPPLVIASVKWPVEA